MAGSLKVNNDVRKAATEAVGDASTPEQKLERLFNFTRAKIKNLQDDASGMTPDQLKKMKENNSPAATLKRGYGVGFDINMLFGALASAVGFEARYVMLGDRSRSFFDINFPNRYFMNGYNVAVKVGEQWRFFDPASQYVPFGMLRWQEEGIPALVTDSKEPKLIETPLSPGSKSLRKRIAKLKLLEDGSVEGTVSVEHTGHVAVEMKEDYDDETPEQRETKLRESVKARLSTAEVSDIKIENPADPLKPFRYSYRIKVPGYAERTGKRLFIQPAFFQRNKAAMFTTSTRQHNIYFNYPWSENDHVEIEMPTGYALDNAEAPAPLNLGDAGYYKVSLGITKDSKTLVYERAFNFEAMLLQRSLYAQVKQIFDAVYQQDNHAVTLKQGAANVAASSPKQ